jgi:hypothetical protein
MVEVELKSIKDAMSFIQMLEEKAPYPEELLQQDLELSEKGNYDVKASVRSRGALNFQVPDLTRPLGLMKVEAGLAVVEGFGRAKIQFKKSFSETPGLVETKFGFFELKVPWVVLEWRSIRLGWWTINIPVPKVTTMTIRLPSLCFLMNVEKDYFEVFNVLGRTYISYLAIGR